MKTTLILVAVSLMICAWATPQAKKSHKITPEAAAKIALRKFPGKVKGTPHLEHEDGQWQYEVLVKTAKHLKEVNVNADSGKIGSVENTSAAEEAREAKSEKGSKAGG
jgi:peptidase YpeB-like protein